MTIKKLKAIVNKKSDSDYIIFIPLFYIASIMTGGCDKAFFLSYFCIIRIIWIIVPFLGVLVGCDKAVIFCQITVL